MHASLFFDVLNSTYTWPNYPVKARLCAVIDYMFTVNLKWDLGTGLFICWMNVCLLYTLRCHGKNNAFSSSTFILKMLLANLNHR